MHTSHNDRTVRQGMPAVLPGIGSATRCALLAALAGLALLAAGCSTRPPLQTTNPQVQAARQACRDVPDAGRYTCIEQQAIAATDPDVCRLLGIAEDDACLQAVYEAADDPAICDRLYLPGIVPTCQAYYADPDHTPLPLTPTPLAADARLGWLAYMLDGDIWIKDLPDGQPQRITDGGVNEAPRWSPSGRWLAFRKLESQLWLYSLETQQAWAVDQGAPVYQFDWSPVADRLAYSVGSGIMHLSLLTAFPDGSTETTVLVPPQVDDANLGPFVWSPDGDSLMLDGPATGDDGAMPGKPRVITVDDENSATDPLVPYRSDELGLALAYPAGWSVSTPDNGRQGVTISGPPHGAGPEPLLAWLSITRQPAAADASLDDVVAAQLAAYPDLAAQIRRSEITLGGEPAAVLDGLPGIWINRQIFVLHDGQLYSIVLSPYGDTVYDFLGDEAKEVWQTVSGSWQFITGPE